MLSDANFLKENNARHVWHPMAHPSESITNPPVIICEGSGTRIKDIDGNETLDAVGGLWNVNLGFSCEPVKAAISEQLARLPYYSAFKGSTNDSLVELSFRLREFFEPDGLSRAFFTSGGSDSVEIALRLSRQYHKLRGEGGRTKFLSLKKGYHGTHMGGASVNGNANFRTQYEPLLAGCYHIPAPYAYRNPFNETDPLRLSENCLNALEDEIAFQGAGTIAAMIMEPVLGAGGVIVPPDGFVSSAREICERHGILFIADEVITAFGRTGHWSGSRGFGVQPDLMTTAKAITNGFFPFGAVMISDKVADVFESNKDASGTIFSGYTYSGHPVGAAAAIASLEEMQKQDVPTNAAARGDELFEGYKKLMKKHEIVGDVRGGRGLMLAMELVENKKTKTPLGADRVSKVWKTTYDSGVMVRVSAHNIFISPALIITKDDVNQILNALDQGLGAA